MTSEFALPQGWVAAPIRDLLEANSEGRVIGQGWSPQCESGPSESLDDWGVLKTTAIQPGLFAPEHNKRLPAHLDPRPAIEVKPGDLLLTCAGPRGRCGVSCLVRTTRPRLMLSGKMYRFRAKPGLIAGQYLEYFLQSSDAVAEIDRMKTGGSDSGLNLTHDRFLNLSVPVPPAVEQTRIVLKLEELLSDLDAGVAELKAAQKKLQQYRQSLLKAAVEGSLTAAWREAHPAPAETGAQLLERILCERRARWDAQQLAKYEAQGKAPPKGWQAKYSEPVGPDRNDLPKLPTDWVWASVDQLSRSIRNGVSSTPNKEGLGLPILRINAVRPMQVRLDEIRHLDVPPADVSEYCIEVGDLLATRYNGSVDLLGVFGLVRGLTGSVLHPDKLIRIKPVLEQVLGPWLEIAANSGASRRYIVGRVKTTAGQTGISGEDLKKMPIPLPPLAEQIVSAGQVALMLEAIEHQLVLVDRGLAQSIAQRQNLLRAAFAGHLVPQDPKDEPASVLLARIRAEREGAIAPKRTPRRRTLAAATTP